MAKFSNYLILVAFFMTTAIAKIATTNEETAKQCATHIGAQCGKQIYDKLFDDNKYIITEECCYKLVQTGYPCHTRMTLHVLTNPEFKNANWTKVLTKGDKIFHMCDYYTKPANLMVLAKCVEKIGSKCGEVVFNNLIHGKTVAKHCCEKLVKMGQHCHINMVKALIRTLQMRDENAIQLLDKSNRIFHQCQHVEWIPSPMTSF